MASNLPINPETKVGELLQAYPHLEEILISASPAFKQLRNPVLRRTVAKVASIRRIAGVGGLELQDLIRTLRREAGIETDTADPAASPETPAPAESESDGTEVPNASPPEDIPGLESRRLAALIDADALLAHGENPLGTILPQARALAEDEVIKLASKFPPEPLKDALSGQGLHCVIRKTGPESYETFIFR